MVFKISREQIRTFFITSAVLLAAWIILGHYARFEAIGGASEDHFRVNVSFLVPMNHGKTAGHLTVTCSDLPGREVTYQVLRVSRNKMQVIIREPGYPRGLEYNLKFDKAPALVPPFTVTAHKKVRITMDPRVVALEPPDNVPTTGPLTLAFNTPVDPESFREHVSSTAPGSFSPQQAGAGRDGPRYDYSRWVFTPQKRLDNSTRYKISVAGGLRGIGGGISREGRELYFTTAPALEAAEIYPRPFDPSIWLSRRIYVRANQELKAAEIKVEGMAGEVLVAGNNAVFKPEELFLPAQKYRVSINLTSVHGEKWNREFWYGTTNLGNLRWISIKLGNPCTVRFYEGNRPLTSCEGWLTIPGDRVPQVTMYEVKRGSTAEFNPRDTSPVRYIMLNADIMIHHQRPGEAHDHALSGLPPSYGCILLNKPDVDRIFDTVPAKCMVIVH
ncbi:MAG: Ig-like domain-containing protein [Peptococcaceae bacterium]|nr:Ig-like domain-containing protein [Peptococcaceae bacterium]